MNRQHQGEKQHGNPERKPPTTPRTDIESSPGVRTLGSIGHTTLMRGTRCRRIFCPIKACRSYTGAAFRLKPYLQSEAEAEDSPTTLIIPIVRTIEHDSKMFRQRLQIHTSVYHPVYASSLRQVQIKPSNILK